jgi:hypothetical protein
MAIEVTVYVSSPVAEYGNRFYGNEYRAAEVVYPHIRDAVNAAGHTLNFTYGDNLNYTSQESSMSAELDYFDNQWLPNRFDSSSNSNLMLLSDQPDGSAGLAEIGGDAALLKWSEDLCSHGTYADRYGDRNTTENRIRGAIHEIGHNFGMEHADGLRYYTTNGTTYSTPHGCEVNGTLQSENNCGEPCADTSIDKWDHYYDDDCAANEI